MAPLKQAAAIVCAYVLIAAGTAQTSAQQPLPAEGDQAQLLAVLQSDAPVFEKAKACQRLAVIATKDAVPVLTPLLGDERLGHYARYALEPIVDPAVDQALRDALGKLDGKLLIGVINSVGMRRDTQAVDTLVGLIDPSRPKVAEAAIGALGQIASPPAVEALRQHLAGPAELREVTARGCLAAADMLLVEDKQSVAASLYDAVHEADVSKHLRIAALHGTIRARRDAGLTVLAEQLEAEDQAFFRAGLQIAQMLPGKDVTQALTSRLEKLPPERQALLIAVLGDRGDRTALPVVLQAAAGEETRTRTAAVRALAMLGDVSAVPLLLKLSVDGPGEVAPIALDSLAAMPGYGVNEALAELLSQSEGRRCLILVQLAGRRRIAATAGTLSKLADSSDADVRSAAIKALGFTVDKDSMSTLIDRMISSTSPDDRAAIKLALKKACQRMPDRDACASQLIAQLSVAPAESQVDLLELLGVLGGDKALAGVSATAIDSNEQAQDAATRVMGAWMSADAAPALLDLAKTGNEKFRIRALRGYIRIIRQFGMPADERLHMCRQALAAADRDEEKRLVLDALTRIPSAEALELCASHLQNDGLKDAASKSAVAMAEKLVTAQPEAVAQAMALVLKVTEDRDLTDQAKVLLERTAAKARN